ncbi:hypothetical protein cand_019020 [Cryptosporidium andersoni]|uniref:Transmembrane protein n=1 Tax=Cryptosporidium andersoni TaxID=117008 RepID=A0A1J4MAR5_9CRYT|nr:hypothetical protein cand_019020 [Cryptosporidium andersoni]
MSMETNQKKVEKVLMDAEGNINTNSSLKNEYKNSDNIYNENFILDNRMTNISNITLSQEEIKENKETIKNSNLNNKPKRMKILRCSSKGFILFFGFFFLSIAIFGIIILLLVLPYAEYYIGISEMEILEININQMSNYNNKPFFDISTLIRIDKISNIPVKLKQSLLTVKYSTSDNIHHTQELGELFISKVLITENNQMLTKGKFTLTNLESIGSLFSDLHPNIHKNLVEQRSDKYLTLYGEGLMTIEIFKITFPNLRINKTLGRFLIKSPGNEFKKESLSKLSILSSIFPKGLLITSPRLRNLNDEISMDFSIEFNVPSISMNNSINRIPTTRPEDEADTLAITSQLNNSDNIEYIRLPSVKMENIGNMRFKIFLDNFIIGYTTWHNVKINPGYNFSSWSIKLSKTINKKLKEILKNIIIGEPNSPTKYIRIKGHSADNEAMDIVIKKVEVMIELNKVLAMIHPGISELSGDLNNSIDKIIKIIKLKQVKLIKDVNLPTITGKIQIKYLNPVGDALLFRLNNLMLISEIQDEENYKFGTIFIKLDNSETTEINQLSQSANILLLSNFTEQSVAKSLKLDHEGRLERFLEQKLDNYTHVNVPKERKDIKKCTNKNKEAKNLQEVEIEPCIQFQELNIIISVSTENIESEIKILWLNKLLRTLLQSRNIWLLTPLLSFDILTIFGNLDINDLKLPRRLVKVPFNNSKDLDKDYYKLDEYYHEDSEVKIASHDEVGSLADIIKISDIQILGEGFNDSWLIKVIIKSDIMKPISIDEIDVGPLGIHISYKQNVIGFIGANRFSLGGKENLPIWGVLKPKKEVNSENISRDIENLLISLIVDSKKDINKNDYITVKLVTGTSIVDYCMKYFNYPNFIGEREVEMWLSKKMDFSIDRSNITEYKNWISHLLNGQILNIPFESTIKNSSIFNLKSKLSNILSKDKNQALDNVLCSIRTILFPKLQNETRSVSKLNSHSNLDFKIQNAEFYIYMNKRENDLEIPFESTFDLSIPNIISENIFINVLSLSYNIQISIKETGEKFIEFSNTNKFSEKFKIQLSEPSSNSKKNLIEWPATKVINLHLDIKATSIKLIDKSGQWTNFVNTIFGLPSVLLKKPIKSIEINTLLSLKVETSLGVWNLSNMSISITKNLPECTNKNEINITIDPSKFVPERSSLDLFSVDSIQIQRIRLILPPRGADIQLKTSITLPKYFKDISIDIIMGQCIFEISTEQERLLAIVKTPKQMLIGSNRTTQAVCSGFIPAKSWLAVMNLLSNDQSNNTTNLCIKAINTPHGIPYWLVQILSYVKLPISNTLHLMDTTEYSSITFG